MIGRRSCSGGGLSIQPGSPVSFVGAFVIALAALVGVLTSLFAQLSRLTVS